VESAQKLDSPKGGPVDTEDRYFFKVDRNQKPVALYRLRHPFLAEQWFQGRWQHSDRLLVYLRDGEIDLDRCSEEAAREFRPEAFEYSKENLTNEDGNPSGLTN
jgi:hypothetical protein